MDAVAEANAHYEQFCRGKKVICSECKEISTESYHLRWCESCYFILADANSIDFIDNKWKYVDANEDASKPAKLAA